MAIASSSTSPPRQTSRILPSFFNLDFSPRGRSAAVATTPQEKLRHDTAISFDSSAKEKARTLMRSGWDVCSETPEIYFFLAFAFVFLGAGLGADFFGACDGAFAATLAGFTFSGGFAFTSGFAGGGEAGAGTGFPTTAAFPFFPFGPGFPGCAPTGLPAA